MSNKPKICFVSPYIYPLFNPDVKTMFGGFEVRIATIVREIVRRGNFDVSIIVADHGQPHFENREGVEIISWQGKPFFGIPIQADPKPVGQVSPAAPANPAAEPAAVETFALDDETNEGLEIPPPAPTLAAKPAGLQRRVKAFYKRAVPWRTRIIFTALAAGIKASLKNLVAHWINAARHLVWGVTSSVVVLKGYLRQPVHTARTAAGNIGDFPVFAKEIHIFDEANADLYIAPGNSHISSHAAFYAKSHSKSFVMLAGSDIDLSLDFLHNPEGHDLYFEPYAYKRYTIQTANLHIVQNERQAELAKAYGVSPVLIRNPINLKKVYPKVDDPKLILWVGNTDERVKRPSLMVEAARRLPEFQFLMIVTPSSEADYERLRGMAGALPNLDITTRVPFNEVEKYFAQAKVFVNTSKFEGFPNTFLQAGKYGVPVVSLNVDPSGIFSQHGCGMACGDNFEEMIAVICKMMTDNKTYAAASQRIADYVHQNHDQDEIIPRLEELFTAALARQGRQ